MKNKEQFSDAFDDISIQLMTAFVVDQLGEHLLDKVNGKQDLIDLVYDGDHDTTVRFNIFVIAQVAHVLIDSPVENRSH